MSPMGCSVRGLGGVEERGSRAVAATPCIEGKAGSGFWMTLIYAETATAALLG